MRYTVVIASGEIQSMEFRGIEGEEDEFYARTVFEEIMKCRKSISSKLSQGNEEFSKIRSESREQASQFLSSAIPRAAHDLSHKAED